MTLRATFSPHLLAISVLLLLAQAAIAKPYVAPLPGYKAAIEARLQQAWRRAIQPHITQRNTGTTVLVRFEITPAGEIKSPTIRFNSGSTRTAEVALRTLRATRLPAMPAKVQQALSNRPLVHQIEFVVFDWYHGPFYRRGR